MNKYDLNQYRKVAVYTVKGEQEVKLKGFGCICDLMEFFKEDSTRNLLTVLSIIKNKNGDVAHVV